MSDDPYWNPGPTGEPSGRFAGGDPLVTDTFEGWWHASLDVVQRSWRTVGLILLIGVVLPRWVLTAFENNTRAGDVQVETATWDAWLQAYTPGVAVSVISFVLTLAFLYVAGSAGLAAVRTAAAEAAGGFLSLGEAFSYGFKRGRRFFLWLLLAWATIIVGLVLCVLPGLWAVFALSLMAPAAVFEPRRSPYARSIQLTHSAFWPALGRIVIVVLVVFAANILIGIVGLLLAGVWYAVFASWLAAFLTVLTEAVMSLLLLAPMIWVVAASLCTYAWLRGRAESVSATSLSAEAAGILPPRAPGYAAPGHADPGYATPGHPADPGHADPGYPPPATDHPQGDPGHPGQCR